MSPENGSDKSHPDIPSGYGLVGARVTNEGLDLSHAALMKLPEQPEAQATAAERQGQKPAASPETGNPLPPEAASPRPLDVVLDEARQHGLEETDLRRLVQGLNMDDKPSPQQNRLRHRIRTSELDMTPPQLLTLARRYQKERTRATENGELLHYHQTDLANFDTIVEHGGLLSHETQKSLGIAGSSSGSRPDVVQFTRDHYDAAGTLRRPGLSDSNRVGVANGITFIFDDRLMDTPDYDSIVEYPNVPFAPLGLLKAVAVGQEADIPRVSARLAEKGIQAEVVSRRHWIDRQQAAS